MGLKGERKVAQDLNMLPDSWHALHSVPVGTRGADIDHVLVGPAGVFTVNTKYHPDAKIGVGGDTFKINGRSTRYVKTARDEARRASSILGGVTGMRVEVIGVIALAQVSSKIPPEPQF